MQKSLFERPASLNDENRAEYEELLASVAAGVAPRDILEEFWVEDIATEAYNGRQLRRFKDSLLKSSARHGLKEAIDPLVRDGDLKDPMSTIVNARTADALVQDWYAREPEALKQVAALLEAAGLTMDDVYAQTLAMKLDDFERIERMVTLAQARRNGALREMDRHRKALGETKVHD